MESVSGCPVWEAVMAWKCWWQPAQCPWQTLPSPRQESFGAGSWVFFGCWQDPANAANEESLQGAWEEGADQLLDCHYGQVEKDSKKVVVTRASA